MSYRALIIEDNHALADALRIKLGQGGHDVAVATNRRDAYHLLDEQKFDFVLLDLRLPTHEGDMDPDSQVGFEILDRIRDHYTRDELPVIVMTAYEETSQTAVRALKALANDYITKPFRDSPESLDNKLKQIFRDIEWARNTGTVSQTQDDEKAHKIVFKRNRHVEVDGIPIKGVSANLIWLLGKKAATLRFDDADSPDPRMTATAIAHAMGVEQENTVIGQVSRFRRWIAAEYSRRDMGPIGPQDIIRNVRDRYGYELNRDTCDFNFEYD